MNVTGDLDAICLDPAKGDGRAKAVLVAVGSRRAASHSFASCQRSAGFMASARSRLLSTEIEYTASSPDLSDSGINGSSKARSLALGGEWPVMALQRVPPKA